MPLTRHKYLVLAGGLYMAYPSLKLSHAEAEAQSSKHGYAEVWQRSPSGTMAEIVDIYENGRKSR
ncbi:hypothetical protein LCGC14_0878310 [marine sediment metagenome]|uniref:Uncharacterized protein n=1 Tax=marine sediment metagenome TaxID=412755 RepID=A0A0F9RM35_9ZZZZ